MAPRESETWQEAAASTSERLRQLEKESDRTRSTLHELRSEAQSVRFLAEKIAELAGDIHNLAARVETISRHAVQRPSQPALVLLGQYLGLVVAIVALYVAAH